MSFESYAHHIIQKHRLAVALAVLKEKPENVSVEKYLEDIRNKINNNTNDEIDLSISSDDFKLDDDDNDDNDTQISTNMLERVNDGLICNNDTLINNVANVINESINQNNDDLISNLNSVTILENVIINDIRSNNKGVDEIINSQESISVLKDLVTKDDDKEDCYGEKRRKITQDSMEIINARNHEFQYINEASHKTQSLDSTYYNTQAIDAQNDYSNIDEVLVNKNINTQVSDHFNDKSENYTHVSQSQFNDIRINEILFKSKERYSNEANNNIDKQNNDSNSIINDNPVAMVTESINDLNDKEIYRRNNFGESQNKSEINIGNTNIGETDQQNKYNIENKYYSIENINHRINNNCMTTEFNNINRIIENDDHSVDKINHINNNNSVTSQFENINHIVENSVDKTSHRIENDSRSDNINQTVGNNSRTFDNINQTINSDDQTIESESQFELITFKVIEELNKVKSYVNRIGDRRISGECSLDSGYKSDNQSRSSRSSSQLSGNFLNQSGSCLFNYIINAKFVIDTQEVTNEIAQVLANLIDRLHDEEKYLCFLDELLETVDDLLKETLEGDNDDNFFFKKDEVTHKLLLLNISPHIQKYTIEKIITILQDLQSSINNSEDLYEINRTEESENICYIFHLLEVLIRRFIKSKDLISRSSQNELKKSSITDIWRRKWNPNFKNIETEDLVVDPKGVILKKCAEILNKLVVACMDGYSLISFAALQCFNALQTQ